MRIKKLISIMLVAIISVCYLTGISVSADDYEPAGSSMGTGRHYLGSVSVYDTHSGGYRYYNGNHVRIYLAWKATDGGSDVDINVVFNGRRYTFYCDNDLDNSVDANGYYYTYVDTYGITPGSSLNLYYDVVTRRGYTPPGYYRSAHIHSWAEIW